MNNLYKKTILTVLSVICVFSAFFVVSCKKTPTKNVEIILDKYSVNLQAGEETTVTPSGEGLTSFEFVSSDSLVATVSTDGVIKAISAGSCTITVISGDLSAKVSVTVTKKAENVTPALSVSVIESTSIFKGKYLPLSPIAKLGDDTLMTGTFEFESSDETVATVSRAGMIKALNFGKTIITVKVDFEGDSATAACAVTVVSENKMRFVRSYSPVLIGESIVPELSIGNEKINNVDCSFTSSDENVAIFDNGVVKCLARGEAIVTAEYKGNSATLTVVVCDKKITTKNEFLTYLSETNNKDGFYFLANDIDFERDSSATVPAFSGRLEGNGFAIKNTVVSIIGQLFNGGRINDLAIYNAEVNPTNGSTGALISGPYAGSYSGANGGKISNVYAEITIVNDAANADSASGTLVGIGCNVTCENVLVKAECKSATNFIGSIFGNNWNVGEKGMQKNCVVICNRELKDDVRGWNATAVVNSIRVDDSEQFVAAIESGEFLLDSFDEAFWNRDELIPVLICEPTIVCDLAELSVGDIMALNSVLYVNRRLCEDVEFNYSVTEGDGVISITGDEISALSDGTAILSVSCVYKGKEYHAEISVSVIQAGELAFIQKVKVLSVFTGNDYFADGDNTTEATLVVVYVLNGVETEAELVYSSGNDAVATVDSAGKVTAVSPGKTTITATFGTLTATCEVDVYTKFITQAGELCHITEYSNLGAGGRYFVTASTLDFQNQKFYQVRGNFFGYFNGNGCSIVNAAYPMFQEIGGGMLNGDVIIENFTINGKLESDAPVDCGLIAGKALSVHLKNITANVTMSGDCANARAALCGNVQLSANHYAAENITVNMRFENVTDYTNIAILFTETAAQEYAYASAKVNRVAGSVSKAGLPPILKGYYEGKITDYDVTVTEQ